MKFTLSWLKEHLATEADLATIADTLTAVGLEVEEITDRAAALAPFIVAHVIEAGPHPNADKLKVCRVDTGNDVVQVVCGAPNAHTGMKGVFAASGLTVPGTGMKLKPATIRGVASNGMLCSEREMGLSDQHEGIIELPDDAPVGAPFAQVVGLDDPVIEIAITPNRQDCLGVRGIARDLAAAGLGTLKPLTSSPVVGSFKSPLGVHLDFSSKAAATCPLFAGRYIRGVKNGESPDWLKRKLLAIGLRPISALVDITNLFTYDRARPLHVYDADKVSGDIHVRFGRPGEHFTALDNNDYDVDETMCVIADERGVLGLGGVIGGVSSGCSEDTVNLFLEAALFDPVTIAMTGRALGIESDARYRFERGVDPADTLPGLEVATRLILELCGGEASAPVIAGAPPAGTKEVSLRLARLERLGGITLTASEAARILGALGFETEIAGQTIHTRTPSWRCDIDGEADLIEEVLRIHGYDKIPATPLPRPAVVARPAIDARQRQRRLAGRVLAARGMTEAVTWSFTSSRHAALFGDVPDSLRLVNPISSELDVMRPGLLPNLIAAVGRNVSRGEDTVALFEGGPAYADDSPEGQSFIAAGVRRGPAAPRHWAGSVRPVDAFDAKADALAVLAACGAPTDNLQVTREVPGWYHPGRSGALKLGPKTTLALFGEVHPGVLKAMDVEGPLVAFEVFLAHLPRGRTKAGRTRPALSVSDLPAVERDFSFVVDRTTEAQDVLRAARGADKALIEHVGVFDVYQGDRLEADKKALAITVRLRPRDKTLTDAEIDAISARIITAVEKKTGGQLRG
jgi:phenylalanyl-tRNA synthetase beta chain